MRASTQKRKTSAKYRRSKSPTHALSIRQPWADLILTGQKTIEIRTWKTLIRQTIWLHAGRLWAQNCPYEADQSLPRGGLIGTVDIIDCIEYTSRKQFRRHAPLHRVPASHWTGPLYGFVLDNPRPIPMQTCPGGLKFFYPKLD